MKKIMPIAILFLEVWMLDFLRINQEHGASCRRWPFFQSGASFQIKYLHLVSQESTEVRVLDLCATNPAQSMAPHVVPKPHQE